MNRPTLSVFNFSLKNQTNDSVDIYVDGYIVDSPTLEVYQKYWGDETSVSYKSFRDQIPAEVKTINLYVNSGGGHVGDAMAISDYLTDLENKGVTVNREGRGIVASAATYLVMGKNSRLSENCLFMVHEVSGFAYGDVSSMENQVRAMRKFNDMIVNFYCRETGLSETVVGNMMKAETWLTAEDAKAKNFVKNVGTKAQLTNTIKPEHWPYTNMAMLNTYNSFITPSNSTEMDTKKITDAITTGFNALLEKLGLKDKANDETVQNAFKDFSESITNELKVANEGGKGLTNEDVTKLVNDAITKAFENKEGSPLATALTTATSNFATKTDLSNEMTKLTNDLVQKLGGKSGDENEEKEEVENRKKRNPKNRFIGAKFNENA